MSKCKCPRSFANCLRVGGVKTQHYNTKAEILVNVQTIGIVVVFVTIPLLFGTSVVKDGDKTGS